MLRLKITPPVLRSTLVERRELLCRLESSSADVVILEAPAGYGKTIVLGQFAGRTDRPLAWLNLDEGDTDPIEVISGLWHALEASGLLTDMSRIAVVESRSVLTRGVDQLLEAVNSDAKGILILDHLDELPGQSSLDVIGAVMARSGGRLTVMAATRSASKLPLGLLRVQDDLLELGAEDLAFTTSETREIFDVVGAPQGAPIDDIVEHTEGWPTAIYLTALAMRAGAAAPEAVRGDDMYLADYFREELMKEVPDELESFLVRSSILPRMSGALCDYVLGIERSAELLQGLQEANLLVLPMDRTRTWYRYHSLLREFLQFELSKKRASERVNLHHLASEWFERNGFESLAIEQARRAGEFDRVATLVARAARPFYAEGRNKTVSNWFEWLEEGHELGDHPELAAIGAFLRALDGDPGGAERLAFIAYDDSEGDPRDDSELGPLTLMVRAYQAPSGIDRALQDARTANEVLQHRPEWAHASLGALALTTHAALGIEEAEPLWIDSLWRAEALGARPMAAVARAMRALAAIRRDEWDVAEAITSEAIADIEAGGLHTYITSAMAYIQAARVASHRGDLENGRLLMAAAARIRPLLTVAIPIYSVMTLHEKAKAYIEFADVAGARRLMRDASDILAMRPRLGTLVEEHDELKERLAALPAGTVGPSSLTGAELRLLPLLVTHLTYPEIGDRLYVSKHTVKTQAMSIYRKLGVSSRSEAVEKARTIGLISR